MEKNLVCDDCNFMFKVYSPMQRQGLGQHKPFYCPNCGDNFAVRDYISPRAKTGEYNRIPWQPEELALLKKCLDKAIPPHQIALMLGRGRGSVSNKVKQVRAANAKKSKMER
jgi:hypothetical protein